MWDTAVVPEVCRVRAQRALFDWPDDCDSATTRRQQLHGLAPYFQEREERGAKQPWTSVAALRLTCRSVKAAVDEALNTRSGRRLKKACALAEPLDQFLAHHFLSDTTTTAGGGGGVPLFSASAGDAQAKNRVRMMAEAALGLTGARIHQARLGEVLDYVWREWDFAPAKLHDLRSVLLAPRAVAGEGPGGESMGPAAPLLTIHHLRRGDDFLGMAYSLGITSCLSLGLPDLPHERVEIAMNLLQWHDDDWDFALFVDLTTSSTKWKDILASIPLPQPAPANSGRGRGYRRYNDTTVLDGGSTILATLAAFDRCDGQINNPSFRFDILRKLWDSVGLRSPNYAPGVDGNSGSGSDDGATWTASEVLTTLLACLGFVWQPDVCQVPSDERYGGIASHSNQLCRHTAAAKRQERQHTADFVDKFAHLVAQHVDQTGDTPGQEASAWQLIERQVMRFVGQQRLARAAEYLADRAARRGVWADQPPFALTESGDVTGYNQVVPRLRVLRAHSFQMSPHQNRGFFAARLDLVCPISSGGGGLQADDPMSIQGENGQQQVVVSVSTKAVDTYDAPSEQTMITVRVVGGHQAGHQLHQRLTALAESATVTLSEEENGYDVGDETHPAAADGHAALLIYLNRTMGSPNVELRKKVVATAALAAVGRLLGLSAPPASDDAIADAGLRRDDDNKKLAQAVVDFLWTVMRVTTWDADEGAFPVSLGQWKKWERQPYDDAESSDQYGTQQVGGLASLCNLLMTVDLNLARTTWSL